MFISGAAVSIPSQVVPDEDATTLEMLGMSVVDPSPPIPGLYDAVIPQLPTDFFETHMMPPTPMPPFIPPPLASARSLTLQLSETLLTLAHGFLALKEEVDLLRTQMDMVLYQ
jgi:hypothetical protein